MDGSTYRAVILLPDVVWPKICSRASREPPDSLNRVAKVRRMACQGHSRSAGQPARERTVRTFRIGRAGKRALDLNAAQGKAHTVPGEGGKFPTSQTAIERDREVKVLGGLDGQLKAIKWSRQKI